MQLRGEVDYPTFATELYYEYERWKRYPGRPSRLQCFLGMVSVEDAIALAFVQGGGHVYEGRCEKPAYVGDRNALRMAFGGADLTDNVAQYWEGRPLDSDYNYSPRWECLVACPVEIVREVRLNPADWRVPAGLVVRTA